MKTNYPSNVLLCAWVTNQNKKKSKKQKKESSEKAAAAAIFPHIYTSNENRTKIIASHKLETTWNFWIAFSTHLAPLQ